MGHYCGFGPSVGLSEKSSYTSSFPQFIGTNGTSNNWDYSGWHNNAYSGCHQQVYAAGISPGSGYNYVQRSCGNASVESNDSDRTYWKVHTYQVPDDVQETCSTSFRTSDASDDCYWSVCTFPVSSTKPHVTQTQPSLHDGTVGYSLKVPSKAEYHEMPVPKVSNPIPIENTLEGVPPEQQSQLCEKKERSLEQQTFLKQKYDEAQDNLNQSEECHERSNEEDIHTLCRKLLADLKHIQEERKTMELEAQRKHEEQEIHKELEHFLYNAFNLFEEEQQESEYAPKCFSKPKFSPARPTVGVCSLTNEKNPIMKGFPCVLTRRRTIHFSIKHTNEKSTQAASILCIQEATVHCADESSEINIKKQYVLINKQDTTHPCDLNNDKEVRFTLQYQLPLTSAPCIWDPGIDLFSHKKLHIFPWIPHSTIIILQQEHFFFLEKGRQVQWDSGIQVIDDGITSNSTWTIRDAEWLKITEDCFAEQELMANTSSKMTAFTWHISITETSFILLRNTTYTFDPGVLKIKDTILDKWAVPHQVQFVQHTIELSLLILEAFVQYYAPNGVNSVLNGTSYMLQRDTHSSQDNYFCSLHYKTEYCQMKCLWEYSISSAICVQWGLGVKMSLYGWMDIFILRSETDKPLSCTHIPDLTAWQHQSGGISACYIWDPGTILGYTFIWLVLATSIQPWKKRRCSVDHVLDSGAPNCNQCSAVIIIRHVFYPDSISNLSALRTSAVSRRRQCQAQA